MLLILCSAGVGWLSLLTTEPCRRIELSFSRSVLDKWVSDTTELEGQRAAADAQMTLSQQQRVDLAQSHLLEKAAAEELQLAERTILERQKAVIQEAQQSVADKREVVEDLRAAKGSLACSLQALITDKHILSSESPGSRESTAVA